MINISMQQFVGWFQTKMDSKNASKMESLKMSLYFFYNLADQVSSLYHIMRQKMEKYSDKEEYKDIVGLLNRSLIIITKITQKIPICIDSHFCENFTKSFDFHINLLCTYYHSLCHFELLSTALLIKKNRSCHRRIRLSKESIKCILFISKSKTFTSIILKLCIFQEE